MPYGYFQFVRFAAFVAFSILSYQASQRENQLKMVVYGALALLFQPFIKVALGRELWNVIDVVVALGLLLSLARKNQK